MKQCLCCVHYPAWKNSERDSSANIKGFCNILKCFVSSDHCCNSFYNYHDEIHRVANDIVKGFISQENALNEVPYHQRKYLLQVVTKIKTK